MGFMYLQFKPDALHRETPLKVYSNLNQSINFRTYELHGVNCFA